MRLKRLARREISFSCSDICSIMLLLFSLLMIIVLDMISLENGDQEVGQRRIREAENSSEDQMKVYLHLDAIC